MSPSRSRSLTLGIIAAVGAAVAILGVAAFLLVPVIWSAAATEVATDDGAVRIEAGTSSAEIPLETGWWARPAFGDAGRVELGSPDGRMRVEFRIVRGKTPAEAIAAAVADPIGPLDSEPAGGYELYHATTLDGDRLVGAVVHDEVVVVFVSSPTPDYDAELARLLAQIEVTS